MNFNILSLLTNDQKQKIFLALLLLLIPVAAKFYFFEDFAEGYVKESPYVKSFYSSKSTVDRNAIFFNMLVSADDTYTDVDITQGVSADKFKAYFSYVEPVVAKPLPEEPKTAETPKTPLTPTVPSQPVQESVYLNKVSFIYESGSASYVIIDGSLIRQGQKTKSGLTVKRIEKDRVLLEGKRSSKWVTLEF